MTNGATPDTFTVASLSAAIGHAVTQAFPDQVWVRGEIRDLQRPSSGHVFFSLVDPDDDRVRLPVALFANEKHLVNRVLTRSGAVRMTDGVDVRIRGEVTHYPLRGTVQVRMTLIDPDYTVGKLAAERARVLRSLATEGLLDRNAALGVALVPLRVGLVTSSGSAAEADFLSTIEVAPYRFQVTSVDARVQGVDAVATMLSALERLDGQVDVVAVVRGGGSATDLAAFDDEKLARRIATMRVPVMTGVGHEIDRSVADEVAAVSHKTPTEAAAWLVERVAAFDRRMSTMGRAVAAAARRSTVRELGDLEGKRDRVVRSGRQALDTQTVSLERTTRRIGASSRRLIGEVGVGLTQRTKRLGRTAPLALERAKRDLYARRDQISAADPVRLLARGWSITRRRDGRVIRTVGDVGVGDQLETRLADGVVASNVTDRKQIDEDAATNPEHTDE